MQEENNQEEFLDINDDIFGITLEDPDLNDGVKDIRDHENFTYPCILLNGIEYIDVLALLSNSDKGSFRSLNTWIFADDDYFQIGQIALTFNTLLLMRNLGVIITLYASEENVVTLNLNNPEVLEKYI